MAHGKDKYFVEVFFQGCVLTGYAYICKYGMGLCPGCIMALMFESQVPY